MDLSSGIPVARSESSLLRGVFSALHAVNLPVFALALATGLLLFFPMLRSMVISGYSESIRGMHRWSGRAQIVLALAIAALWLRVRWSGSEIYATGAWRAWRLAHLSFVSAAALGFAATGRVMSSPGAYSVPVVDYSMTTHLWLTYASCAVLIVHAVIALLISRWEMSRAGFGLAHTGKPN